MLFLFLILLISSLTHAAGKPLKPLRLNSNLSAKLEASLIREKFIFIREKKEANDAHAQNNGSRDVVEMDGVEGSEQPNRPRTPDITIKKKDPLDGM